MKIVIDFSDLLAKLPQIKADLAQEAKDVADKIGGDIYGDLILETPVKTGQARNGWNLDDSGPVVHITNNISYIGALNNGHSKQAPAGFVEAIIDRHTKL